MSLFDINGNIIQTGGSSDSFFDLFPDSIGIGGTAIDAMPTSWSSQGDWIFGSNGTVLGNLANGKTEGTSVGFVYNKPFTGTIYLRELLVGTDNHTNSSYGEYVIVADNEEAINNPSYETLSSLKCSYALQIFTIDGVNDTQFIVKADGTYEQRVGLYFHKNDFENGYGIVSVSKFEIPEGKVGYICTEGANKLYLEGWNAVFSYDITDNPCISIDESKNDGTQLKVIENYEDGFMKHIAQSGYFNLFYKDKIQSILPESVKLQTFGKSLYVGGDSLHQYSGGDGFKTSGFITDYNKILGFSKVKNDGYAGSSWTGTTGGGAIKRVTDLVANGVPYDVFILAWGTNNDTSNGTINDEASNDGSSMVGAMKWCISQLRTTFKYSAIGIIIPPPKNNETDINEKANLMIKVCELLHVPYVDMRNHISLNDLQSDNVHLGYGANKYGTAESKLILDICPYGKPLK